MMTIRKIQLALAPAALLTVAFLMFAADAQAQGGKIQAEIPFEFYVGSTRMPPGPYVVRPINSSAIWITNLGTNDAANTLTSMANDSREGKSPRLVFSVYEGQYFLSDVFWADSGIGRSLVKSQREVALAKSHTPARVVSIAKGK